MSLYDKASLVMIPSGYKASSATLYSVVPNTSVGDFDVTVDADATRVNKDGLIESVAANQARLDYPLTNGVVGDCPHLLLEPSRTNLITDYTGAGFSAFNGASITANDSVSPDGSTNATLMTTTGSSNEVIQQASIGISSGQSYTISGYFRLKSGTLSNSNNAFKGLDGFSGGITGSTFNSSITSEWQRLSFTTTSTTTSGRVQIKCEDAAEILIWGLQVELGSYETSVIPTSSGTVTRSADTCNGAGDSSTFNDSEGVLFVEFAALANDLTHRRIAISDGTTSNIVYISFDTASNRILANANGRIMIYTVSNETEFQKAAVYYNVTAPKLFVNGVLRETETAMTAISGLNELAFDGGAVTNNFYGKVKQAMVFNEALSDSELQQLTS